MSDWNNREQSKQWRERRPIRFVSTIMIQETLFSFHEINKKKEVSVIAAEYSDIKPQKSYP